MSTSRSENAATARHVAHPIYLWRARLAASMAVVLVASMLGLVTVAAPAAADTAPTRPGEPQTVSADRLPTVQINGVVWDQVIVGNTVYATGQFTQARPAGSAPGQNQTPRSNILAYNLTNGTLITTWAPTLNAQGMAIAASDDGSRIFVGGDFTQVSGTGRNRIVALNATTGAVIPTFNPSSNNRVDALAVNGNTLYAGGNFTTLGGQPRTRLAAVNATSGALQAWAPSVDREVVTLTVHPASGRVYAGGSFATANGVEQRGMTSFDGASGATPGALMPWAANQVVQNYGPNTQISSLITDGQSIFGVGWAYFGAGGTTANFEGQFSADPLTGEFRWINGCRGDQFSIAAQGDVLYTAGHSHDCGMIDYNPEVTPRVEHRGLAFDKRGSSTGRYNAFGVPAEWRPFAGRPATDPLHWLPNMAAGTYTGSSQAGYSVKATNNAPGAPNYVVYGGEFPSVNGVGQQGLVRFAQSNTAPNDEGPQGMTQATPTLTAMAPGIVKVNWIAPFDRDNSRLRYEVLRGSTVANSTVIADFELDSTIWKRHPLGFLDLTAPPNTNQTYRIRVRDALANVSTTAAATVSVPAGTRPNSDYLNAVRTSGAIYHWRLDEATGTLARDWARSNDLTLVADAQRGVPGALLNEANTAVGFPASTATNTVRGTTNFFESAPQVFSVEAWIRTTSTQGGKIIGFGGSNTFRSNSNLTDRHIYMTNDGELRFGLRPDMATRQTINSPAGFNDGQWHHVVGTLSGTGASLYVDGNLVAQDAALNKGQVYYGYWRIGGDRLSQWPSAPTREAFEGTIDEVAVYPTALTAARVQANYLASGHTGAPNQAPTAAFTSTATGLNATFDGTGSTDPDPGGSITSYSWNFGDNSPAGTGPQPTHTYPAAGGTFQVTLTVTDNLGAVNSVTQPVVITAPPPNQAPTAAFTFTTNQLIANFNGSGSSDPDPGGSIASYSWNFGDNSPAGSGATPAHTFPGTGNYQVTLTVTDNGGATNAVTQTVSVTGPNQPPVAAFTSTTDGLTVAVDGTTSTDPENAIASYAWNFGNQGTASTATASHTFGAAGIYQVTLTVTDAGGLTNSVTQTVTVAAAGPQPFAADLFTRTVSDGLGTADQGGAWTLSGTAANFSVSGGAGRIQATTSQQRAGYLTAAQSLDFDVAVDLSLNTVASGSGAYASVLARRNTTNHYGVKVRYQPNGSVLAYLVRTVGGTETTLAFTTVPGTVAPNDVLRVRLQGTGSATTATSVKVWRATDAEPAAWLLTNTSAAPAALQVPGHVGVVLYLSSTWAGPAATLSVDNLVATDPE